MYPRSFVTAGVVLGLGGFFDGIVLHQILQWHHLLTATRPATSVGNLEANTLWDRLFHATTYVPTVTGLLLFWRAVRFAPATPPTRVLVGAMLIGWGTFNLVDHHVLGVHHVMDGLPAGPARLAWDLGFLALGAMLLVAGQRLVRFGSHGTTASARRPR